ncbi:O-antigen polymerase [Paenibacillus sp. B-A-8]|uniref:O-antigen polymerase n=1 Tax=Paenibacillus sp. B-A-8 TaxID=3400419 RepID=UPI003B0253FD
MINDMFIFNNIIVVFIIIIISLIFSKLYGDFFNPVSLFMLLWGIIVFNVFTIFEFSFSSFLYFVVAFLSFILPTFILLKKFPDKRIVLLGSTPTQLENIKLILIICIIARFFQIIYDLSVFFELGGDINSIFGDAQSLRFRYLSKESGLFQNIITNFLNYFSELGVILSAIYYKSAKKYMFLIISIILALFHSTLTFSKFAFFLDVIFIVSILTIYTVPKVERKNTKQNNKMLILIGISVILLLNIISNQRGYDMQESRIPGIDSVLIYKVVTYFFGPTLAFLTLLDSNITHSYGIMTFTPFLRKVLEYPSIGTINLGFFDTNVYTLFGSLYIDFGYFGSIFMIFVFSLVLNIIYIKLKSRMNIGLLSIYCILNSALYLSFFDWIGRQTFFWLFPVFVYIIDKLFITKKDKGERRK